METQVVTKAEFAAMIGVSAGRVSQLISEGKIGAPEMQGIGRSAKIKVTEALAALKLRLDMSQMTGNGAATRLDLLPTAPPTSDADRVELRYKLAKLEQQESVNRRIAEDEKARAGIYILAVDAKAEAAKMVSQVLQAFEGGLSDMAQALAAEFELPQRDIIHLMHRQFADVRAKIAKKLRGEAEEAPPHIEIADTEH
jgi:hypothetical protein